MAGAGVPMRLSANEVDGDSDEEFPVNPYSAGGSAYHRRTGSGRSSLGPTGDMSSQWLAPAPGGQRYSSGSTPPSGQGSSPTEMERLDEETPVPGSGPTASNYFAQPTKTGLSQGSSSGGSRENSFGQLAPMVEHKEEAVEEKGKRKSTQEDLMRRGSVDERTTTMSGVRLFVANPDLSD